MHLIIAEKKELGEMIADAIDGTIRMGNSVIYKGDYCIVWASGHLLTLKEPQDYDPTLATWDLSALPIYFPDWDMKPKVIGDTGPLVRERLDQIKGLIEEADYVIHAGDPDEEGQLLVDEILRWAGCTKPVFRLATSDTTVPAIQHALSNLSPNEEFAAGGWSAYARTIADMTFGINMSRFFSLNNSSAKLPVGRVQTPTLALVVKRDNVIENFQKSDYYAINAEMSIGNEVVRCRYTPNTEDPNLTEGRISSASYARDRVSMLECETFSKVVISKELIYEKPPLPLDLLALQTYCGNRFSYSPSQVLKITQSLRSKYKAITYNRSKCRYLTENHFAAAPETINTVIRNIQVKPAGLDMTIHSRCFDSEKVAKAAHFAIIPQNVSINIGSLTEEEQNVYHAIASFYLVQFLPPARKIKTSLTTVTPDGGLLTSSATETIDAGYLSIFPQKAPGENAEGSSLSKLAGGTYPGTIISAGYEKRETKPPLRYTQTSLNKDMASIAKYVHNQRIKDILLEKDKNEESEKGSIGTPATRGDIISGLISHGLLEQQGKYIISTALGRELIRILPKEAKEPDLTAYWWTIQEDIRSGRCRYTALTESVLDTVRTMISTSYPSIDLSLIPQAMLSKEDKKPSLGQCPRCKNAVIEGKKGFGCSGWRDGCKFVIWKKPASPMLKNISLTATDVKTLLTGQAIYKRNLVSKNGNLFESFLKIEDNPTSNHGANLVLVKDSDITCIPSVGKCPRCGRPVIERPKQFRCAGAGNGCTFAIWKKSKMPMLEEVTFTAANTRDFLIGRKVKKSNLKKRSGERFEAYLIMKDDPSNPYGPQITLAPRGHR